MVVNLLVFTIATCYVIFKYLYDEQSYSLQTITRRTSLPLIPGRPMSWAGQFVVRLGAVVPGGQGRIHVPVDALYL